MLPGADFFGLLEGADHKVSELADVSHVYATGVRRHRLAPGGCTVAPGLLGVHRRNQVLKVEGRLDEGEVVKARGLTEYSPRPEILAAVTFAPGTPTPASSVTCPEIEPLPAQNLSSIVCLRERVADYIAPAEHRTFSLLKAVLVPVTLLVVVLGSALPARQAGATNAGEGLRYRYQESIDPQILL